jgi:uncharacterized protein YndB with AHSA1/START domain
MNRQITTKFKIHKLASEIFEAIVNPIEIGQFWFSSSSGRWEQGKLIIVRYDEYGAEGIINVLELQENKKILFSWGKEHGNETIVNITLSEQDDDSTLIVVCESGFKGDDSELMDKMLDQKGGWVYMLSCLKAYLENDVKTLRASLIH